MKRIVSTALATLMLAGAASAMSQAPYDTELDRARMDVTFETTGETMKVKTSNYLDPRSEALVENRTTTVTTFPGHDRVEPQWSLQ